MRRRGPASYVWRIVLFSAAAAAASSAVMAFRVPLGERRHWRQNYAAERYWGNAAGAAAALAALAGLTAWLLAGRRPRAAAAAGLTLLAAYAYVQTACAGKFRVMEFCSVFTFSGANGSYYCEAERIGPYFSESQKRKKRLPVFASVREFLASYATYEPQEIFPGDTMRVVTHPPGLSLICYGVQLALRRWPAAADALLRGYRRLFRSEWGDAAFVTETPPSARLFLAGVTTLGLLTVTLCSLSAALAWLAAGRLGLAGSAGLVFGLAALFPSCHLYNPGVDQTFPFFAMSFWALSLAAARRRSAWLAAAAGVWWFACMQLSLAFAVVGALAPASACAWALTRSPRKQALAQLFRLLAAGAAAALACALVLRFATGYDTLGSWERCVRNNAKFNAESARSYWAWLLYNPILFLLFLGGPSAVLWAWGTIRAGARTLRRGRVCGLDWLPLSLAAVMAALWLSGVNRGEVERLWMFLMPACVLAGAAGLRLRVSAAPAAAMLLAQAAQVIVFRVCYDAWDIARYLSHDFLR